MISVLIADDEQPAIDELAFLLAAGSAHRRHPPASSGAEAIRAAHPRARRRRLPRHPHAGTQRASTSPARSRASSSRPALVFVTADEEGALEAFDLAAVDYLLKPVRTERLQRSVDAHRRGACKAAPAARRRGTDRSPR